MSDSRLKFFIIGPLTHIQLFISEGMSELANVPVCVCFCKYMMNYVHISA